MNLDKSKDKDEEKEEKKKQKTEFIKDVNGADKIQETSSASSSSTTLEVPPPPTSSVSEEPTLDSSSTLKIPFAAESSSETSDIEVKIFSLEVWMKIMDFLDLKTLISFSEVNHEMHIIAEIRIFKMKEMVCGNYINFQQISRNKEEDIWEMKKIVITRDDDDLVFKNFHSWSSDFCVNQMNE